MKTLCLLVLSALLPISVSAQSHSRGGGHSRGGHGGGHGGGFRQSTQNPHFPQPSRAGPIVPQRPVYQSTFQPSHASSLPPPYMATPIHASPVHHGYSRHHGGYHHGGYVSHFPPSYWVDPIYRRDYPDMGELNWYESPVIRQVTYHSPPPAPEVRVVPAPCPSPVIIRNPEPRVVVVQPRTTIVVRQPGVVIRIR
jgi:hypothetical protein